MQDPKYAGKYGVEQQLKLLSKWLTETGFDEAAMLVSAAAISVYDATHKRPARHRASAPSAREAAPPSAVAEPVPVVEERRRVHGT
jgi:hypothetical protein